MNKRELAQRFADEMKKADDNIKEIVLFGSIARGDGNEDSDVDILIVSSDKEATKDIVMERVTDILLDTEIYLSIKVLSTKEYERLSATHFIETTRREGVPLA